MINIDKHISFWRKGAEEDWDVANQLVKSGKIRHGLFFLHLTLEKILKAHICADSQDIAPKTHNLVRLGEWSKLSLDPEQIDFLAEMNPFNIEGRYPEVWGAPPSREEARHLIKQAGELFEWLKNQL